MKRQFFKRKKLVIHSLVLLVAALFLPVATAQGAVYSFNLDPPNTAENESGNVIRVTGAGVFDTVSGAVRATGSFTIFDLAGAVTSRGTWRATDFDSFLSFGGPSPGFQGGVLDITVTLFPKGGGPITDVPMGITCLVNAPPGFTEDEGTTVGDFTEKTGGTTLFHLH